MHTGLNNTGTLHLIFHIKRVAGGYNGENLPNGNRNQDGDQRTVMRSRLRSMGSYRGSLLSNWNHRSQVDLRAGGMRLVVLSTTITPEGRVLFNGSRDVVKHFV